MAVLAYGPPILLHFRMTYTDMKRRSDFPCCHCAGKVSNLSEQVSDTQRVVALVEAVDHRVPTET